MLLLHDKKVRTWGADCLNLIYRHYGISAESTALRKQLGQSSSTMLAMARIARRRGFHPKLRESVDWLALQNVKEPMIVGWEGCPLVVLESSESQIFTIHDPLVGRRSLDANAFASLFTGTTLTLTPSWTPSKRNSYFQNLLQPWRAMWRLPWNRRLVSIPTVNLSTE